MGNIFNLNSLNSAISKANILAAQLSLNGHVLPVQPPYLSNEEISVTQVDGYNINTVNEEIDTRYTDIFGTPMCFPVRLRKSVETDGFFWLLPTEPIINISSANRLKRSKVSKQMYTAKGGNIERIGTLKERLDLDDLVIQIDGLLTKNDNWTYPKGDVTRLHELCKACYLDVECELLEYFKINQLVIEKFEFPFTKGEENQRYSITAYSDDKNNLFIPL